MNIFLLTHSREFPKTTNTGSLVADVLADKAKVIKWERTRPDPELLASIGEGKVALLYPADDSQLVSESDEYTSYIVLDGTWQESRKIYNKSPYLKSLPAVKIATKRESIYTLRRNQKISGLCTAECVIEVLKVRGFFRLADVLHSRLLDFLSKSTA